MSWKQISFCVLPIIPPFSFVWFNMICLVLLALLPAAFAVDCTINSDGVFEKGCRAFVTCVGGVATVTECQGNEVFDEKTKACAEWTFGLPLHVFVTGAAGWAGYAHLFANICPNTLSNLCSMSKDCSIKQDGKYADGSTGCSTYFTCHGGTFFGHNYCPGGTIFNEVLQSCDWPIDVAPPCGTKGYTTVASG